MIAGHRAEAATRKVMAAIPRPFPRSLARLRIRHLELAVLVVAGALLVVSIFLPFWHLTLHAPQYPRGLDINVYVYKMTPAKNVREVDGLNHYIGMIRLTDAATVERAISRFAMPVIAVLAVASFWLRGRWRWLARLPIMIFPIVFAADLFAWLYYAGHSLDPKAPLSSSIHEFTPRMLGTGRIGQFSTKASFEVGFYLSVVAAVIVLIATLWARKGHDAR
jgi:copper chaperone NosL